MLLFLGTEFWAQESTRIKLGTLKKGVWYEPTGTEPVIGLESKQGSRRKQFKLLPVIPQGRFGLKQVCGIFWRGL